MLTDTILFYLFSLLTLGGGILTITRRSAVHSAISLIASLLGVAGLFLLQRAEFLFAAQIVLYVGGIMVLFLFVIMLVNLDEAARERQFNNRWWLALLCVAAIGLEVLYFIRRGASAFQLAPPAPAAPSNIGNTELVADTLFTQYLLPFEIASVLLLAAVIGSVVMAKKRI